MVSPNNSGPPQREGPPGFRPRGQLNPRQQLAMQTRLPSGNMANHGIPVQSSPNLQGFQQPILPQQCAQQVMPQGQAQHNTWMKQQQQLITTNIENQQLKNGNQQASTSQAMYPQYPAQQYPSQQAMCQQQSQQQNVAPRQPQYQSPQPAASHLFMGQNLQTSNQASQYSQAVMCPTSVRTAFATPGVSPVAAQFPGGSRGNCEWSQQACTGNSLMPKPPPAAARPGRHCVVGDEGAAQAAASVPGPPLSSVQTISPSTAVSVTAEGPLPSRGFTVVNVSAAAKKTFDCEQIASHVADRQAPATREK